MKKYLSFILVIAVCVACQSTSKEEPNTDNSPSVNYREHIVVKGSDDSHVVYEYSDVRIDEVASLAIEYCKRVKPESQANLRDIYMYKNHKRRATFDCAHLAER